MVNDIEGLVVTKFKIKVFVNEEVEFLDKILVDISGDNCMGRKADRGIELVLLVVDEGDGVVSRDHLGQCTK